MRNTNLQRRKTLLIAILLVLTGAWVPAQSAADAPNKPEAQPTSETSMEDLNFRGGDAAMPPFAESVVDVNSGFRRALLSKGMALRSSRPLTMRKTSSRLPRRPTSRLLSAILRSGPHWRI